MRYLHSNRVMHRDLKLENLMLRADGYLCLIDFGLAKLLYSGQAATTFCGSPFYMAPEVVDKGNCGYDFMADWWSCGILLFEMVTGSVPFTSRSSNQL